ncbi:cytochrome b/b6 domain-containing protein, partial [bacterium]|nr:cytochrome b/b6 domain-containing protein [bacterium]
NQGKHESVDCIQCHQPVSEESFAAIPHQMTGNKPPDCGDCHGRFFDAINKGFSYDIHRGLLPNNFRCDSCHDYHQTGYLTDRTPNPTPHDKIKYSNHYCLICHEKELKATAGTVKELINAHTMLPQMEQHFRSARCVDCHTAPNDSSNHHVLASTETVACTECHSTETLLLKKLYRPNRPVSIEFRFLNQGLFNDAGLIDKIKNAGGTIPEVDPIRHDSDSWRFTNQPLFSHFYVMGATRHKMADRLYVSILCVSAGLILLHLILRGLFRLKRKVQKADFEEVFVNTLQVRIWHWINALLVILLMISGYTMRYVGKGETLIDFAFSIKLHEKAGIFLVACFAFFLLASV